MDKTASHPFQEKSQSMFNAKMQHRTSIPSGPGHSKVISNGNMKGMGGTSRHGNNSQMYNTQTDANRSKKIESKENPVMWQPITKTKANSSYQTKPVSTTGPNSARGGRIDLTNAATGGVSTRRQAFVQNSMNRTQSINLGSRAGSIDKKVRNQSGKFVNQSQILKGGKPNDIKTQSLILSKNVDFNGAFHSTKNQFFKNELNAQKPKKHQSIIQSQDLDDKDFNPKHHQSVVVYSKKPILKSSASGALLPATQRIGGRQNMSQIASVSHFSNQNTIECGSNAIGPQKTKSQIQATQKLAETENQLSDEGSETEMRKQEIESTISSEFSRMNIESKKSVSQIFSERVAKMKKEMMPELTLSDQLDYRNPQMLSEYAQDIYHQMRKEEVDAMVPPDYLQKVQTEIKDTSRAFLIEWIIDVHRKFRLTPECLYVATYIIDQFMSKQKILKNQLHLLGVATLFLAAKYEEIYPPELRDFLAVSENKFTKKTVLQMEKDILHVLNFRITSPSAYRFLQRFRRMSVALNDDEVFFYAQYLQEIQLLDASLLKFKQSEIAAASMILASKQLKKINCWNKEMEKFSGYKESDLTDVVREVKSFCLEINPKFISTLKYKFNKPEYGEVAKHQFKF